MIEKVNPMHPDKIADRIAGAIVDEAYKTESREDVAPKIAVEVLLGHNRCLVIAESSVDISSSFVEETVARCSGHSGVNVDFLLVPQDPELAANQDFGVRCGDNGIFKGVPYSGSELATLTDFVQALYSVNATDGKFIYDAFNSSLTICQSNAYVDGLKKFTNLYSRNDLTCTINPIGFWTGGIDVDSGATNRKLGSDMGEAVTGGGLHGKDLSKADVSVNIACFLFAQVLGDVVTASCAIGDRTVVFTDHKDAGSGRDFEVYYEDVTEIAGEYVKALGGFESLGAWGLTLPVPACEIIEKVDGDLLSVIRGEGK